MVQNAYKSYPPTQINRVWLTMQSCYNEIIACRGGNNYKIPHMNKEKLEKAGKLPKVLEVHKDAYEILCDMEDPEFECEWEPEGADLPDHAPSTIREKELRWLAEDAKKHFPEDEGSLSDGSLDSWETATPGEGLLMTSPERRAAEADQAD